ncbi:acyltransferase [uncultured Fibrobacter sp.]|uniref:acyltransferase family protein n=1 Tax=uncultured Fibrobacter sp. TaxID=261512 RepID=UPI0025E2D8FB|nr:acyltransferase [uncultured Fibrobacter sp.]
MQRYDSFNGLRGYAAVGILLMHYLANMNPIVGTYLKKTSPLLYGQIIPFLTMFVYMFFIVSAFSMCCGYFRRFNTQKFTEKGRERVVSEFDTEKFYSKRYARIWPFFALLVLIDVVMKPSISEFYQAFADLTLAFNFLPNPDISVIGVGWFLGVVFLFYMIFPWFVYLLQSKRRAWFAMVISLAFHVILVQYFLTSEFCTESQINSPRHNIVFSFPFFMVGGLLYLYREKLCFPKMWQKIILLVLCLVTTGIQFTPYAPKPFGENILWAGVIFILWVIYAISGGISIKGFKLLDNKVAAFLGSLSMEIYLCHMVMFRIVEKVHLEKYIGNAHLLYWTYCVLGIGLAILFSWTVTKVLFPKCGLIINRIRGV